MRIKTNILFKTISIILAVTLLVNDVSFAAEEVRSRISQGFGGQSCLATPLFSKPPAGVKIVDGKPVIVDEAFADNLLKKSPSAILWYLVAESLVYGHSTIEARNYIRQTLVEHIEHLVSSKLIAVYDWEKLTKGSIDGKDVFILPFADGRKLIFTLEPYDPHVHFLKFDLPKGSVTVRVEGVTPPAQVKPSEEQPPVIEAPQPDAPQVVSARSPEEIKPAQTKFESLRDKMKKYLGWLNDRWKRLENILRPVRRSPVFQISALVCAIGVAGVYCLPIVIMECWLKNFRRQWQEEEARLREKRWEEKEAIDEAKDDEDKDLDESFKEAEDALTEINEIVEKDGENADSVLESNLGPDDPHDILSIMQALSTKYMKVTKPEDRAFANFVEYIAGELAKEPCKSKYFPDDGIDDIRRFLGSNGVGERLRTFYAKCDEHFSYVEPVKHNNGNSDENISTMTLRPGTDLGQFFNRHSHIILLVISIGAYIASYFILGHADPVFLAMAAVAGIPGQGEPPGSDEVMERIKSNTIDVREYINSSGADDTFYIGKYAKMLDNYIGGPSNNIIITGDSRMCKGLLEAAIIRSEDDALGLKNIKKARFVEINTARFADKFAVQSQTEREVQLLCEALETLSKNAEGKDPNGTKKQDDEGKTVLVLNLQEFRDIREMKAKTGGALYSQIKTALDSAKIPVIILCNSNIYNDYLVPLTEDKTHPDGKLIDECETIDLRKEKTSTLEQIIMRHIARLNVKYVDIRPSKVRITVNRDVVKDGIAIVERHYLQGFPVNKMQELLDSVITRRLTKGDYFKLRRQELEKKLGKLGRGLSGAARNKKSAEEIAFLEEALDRNLTAYEELKSDIAAHEKFVEDIKRTSEWNISIDDIAEAISKEMGIPVSDILAKEGELLKEERFDGGMKDRIVGQDSVIEKIGSTIRGATGAQEKERPNKGVFIFIGPTGVGKTAIAKALSEHLFGSEDAMVRLDMSEYASSYDTSKLIGASMGYLGFEGGGQLTNQVMRKPYSVVLLDEIEKAHKDVFDLLLGPLDSGEMVDGNGNKVSFKNTVLLMTSNYGFSKICREDRDHAERKKSRLRDLDKKIRHLNENAGHMELVKELHELRMRLGSLLPVVKNIGIEDKDLADDLAKIEHLISIEEGDAGEAYRNRKKAFLTEHFTREKNTLEQAVKMGFKEEYTFISMFKEGNIPEGEDRVSVMARIDGMITNELENFKRGYYYASGENAEDDREENKAGYARLLKIKSREKDEERIKEFVRYITDDVRRKIIRSIEKDENFRPELLGRVDTDNIIVVLPPSRKDLDGILNIKLRSENKRLRDQGYGDLVLDAEVRKIVLKRGYDAINGARPLIRSLKETILDPLAIAIIKGSLDRGRDIYAELIKGEVVFSSRDLAKDENILKHREIIETLKRGAKGSDVSGILGIMDSKAPADAAAGEKSGEKPDEKALRERFEIDLPLLEPLPPLDLSNSELDEIVVKLEKSIKDIQNGINRLRELQAKSSDIQQKNIIELDVREKNVSLEDIIKRKNIFEAKKQGNDDKAKELYEDYVKQRDMLYQAKRKQLNSTFEHLTLDAHLGILHDVDAPVEPVVRSAQILKQRMRSYPCILSNSRVVQDSVVNSLVVSAAAETIGGFENKRFLRIKIDKITESMSMLGKFEKDMNNIIETIEKDDIKKGITTTIVIDFDPMKGEIERTRINPFLLGYFLRMFKTMKTISFIMTTSKDAIVNEECFNDYLSLVDIPNQTKEIALEDLYLNAADKLLEEQNGTLDEPLSIKFGALKMASRLWDYYLRKQSIVDVFKRWLKTIVQKRSKGRDYIYEEMRDALEQLDNILMYKRAGGSISLDDLKRDEQIVSIIARVRALKTSFGSADSYEINDEDVLDSAYESETARGIVDIDKGFFGSSEKDRILNLEKTLNEKVLDQPEAVRAFCREINIAYSGLKEPASPNGVFIFAGPTGCGKTQLASAAAEALGLKCEIINMGEYATEDRITSLIGTPPSIAGFGKDGRLTGHIEKYPHSLIVLDEIDKIRSEKVFNLLLQALDDGRITSGDGVTHSCRDTIFVLTTNLGMTDDIYNEMERVIKTNDPKKLTVFASKMEKEVRRAIYDSGRLSPEFLNRMHAVVVFNPLLWNTLLKIPKVFLDRVAEAYYTSHKIHIEIGADDSERQAIEEHLVNRAYRSRYGARKIKNTVQSLIRDTLQAYYTNHIDEIGPNDKIIVHIRINADNENEIFYEHKKCAEEITEIDKDDEAVLKIISGLIAGKMDEPVTMNDLWTAFGMKQKKDIGRGEKLVIAGDGQTSDQPELRRKDRGMITAINGIRDSLPEKISIPKGSAFGGTQDDYAKSMKQSLFAWTADAVELGKIVNADRFMQKIAGGFTSDFYRKPIENLDIEAKDYYEDIKSEKNITLRSKTEGGKLYVSVTFNSVRSYVLEEIFGTEYQGEENVIDKTPVLLRKILRSKLAIEKLGGKMNFYIEDGKATLWISVPVEEVKEPKPAGPTLEEIAAASAAKRDTPGGKQLSVKSATSVRGIMVSLGYAGLGKENDEDFPLGTYKICEAKPLSNDKETITEEVASLGERAFIYTVSYSKTLAGAGEQKRFDHLEYIPSENMIKLVNETRPVAKYNGDDLTFSVNNSGINGPRFLIPAHIYEKLVDQGAKEILDATHVEPVLASPLTGLPITAVAETPMTEKEIKAGAKIFFDQFDEVIKIKAKWKWKMELRGKGSKKEKKLKQEYESATEKLNEIFDLSETAVLKRIFNRLSNRRRIRTPLPENAFNNGIFIEERDLWRGYAEIALDGRAKSGASSDTAANGTPETKNWTFIRDEELGELGSDPAAAGLMQIARELKEAISARDNDKMSAIASRLKQWPTNDERKNWESLINAAGRKRRIRYLKPGDPYCDIEQRGRIFWRQKSPRAQARRTHGLFSVKDGQIEWDDENTALKFPFRGNDEVYVLDPQPAATESPMTKEEIDSVIAGFFEQYNEVMGTTIGSIENTKATDRLRETINNTGLEALRQISEQLKTMLNETGRSDTYKRECGGWILTIEFNVANRAGTASAKEGRFTLDEDLDEWDELQAIARELKDAVEAEDKEAVNTIVEQTRQLPYGDEDANWQKLFGATGRKVKIKDLGPDDYCYIKDGEGYMCGRLTTPIYATPTVGTIFKITGDSVEWVDNFGENVWRLNEDSEVYVIEPQLRIQPTIEEMAQCSGTIGTGVKGAGNYRFNYPSSIFVIEDGTKYIADTHNHRIQIYDKDNNCIGTIGTGIQGAENDQLNTPNSIFVTKDGTKYIADTYNNRIQIYDKDNNYIGTIGTGIRGAGNDQFNYPRSIFVTKDGVKYIADSNNHRIQICDKDNNYIGTIGTGVKGAGNDQFNYPRSIFVTEDGVKYIADTDNHRIQICDKDNNYIDTIGTGVQGAKNDQFNYPCSIFVTENGTKYIADTHNHRIQICDKDNNYIGTIGTGVQGSGNDQFNAPYSIFVTENGTKYIADTDNHRIQIYDQSAGGATPTSLSGLRGASAAESVRAQPTINELINRFKNKYIVMDKECTVRSSGDGNYMTAVVVSWNEKDSINIIFKKWHKGNEKFPEINYVLHYEDKANKRNVGWRENGPNPPFVYSVDGSEYVYFDLIFDADLGKWRIRMNKRVYSYFKRNKKIDSVFKEYFPDFILDPIPEDGAPAGPTTSTPNSDYIQEFFTPTPNGILKTKVLPSTSEEYKALLNSLPLPPSQGENRRGDISYMIDNEERCVKFTRSPSSKNDDFLYPGTAISEKVGKFGASMGGVGHKEEDGAITSIIVLDDKANYISIISRSDDDRRPEPIVKTPPEGTPVPAAVSEIVDNLISIVEPVSARSQAERQAAITALEDAGVGNQNAINLILKFIQNPEISVILRKIARGNRTAIDAIIEETKKTARFNEQDFITLGEIAQGDQKATAFILKIINNEFLLSTNVPIGPVTVLAEKGNADRVFALALDTLKKTAPKGDTTAITALEKFINAAREIPDGTNIPIKGFALRVKAAEVLWTINPGDETAAKFIKDTIEKIISTPEEFKLKIEVAKTAVKINPVNAFAEAVSEILISSKEEGAQLILIEGLANVPAKLRPAAGDKLKDMINKSLSPKIRLVVAKALARNDRDNIKAREELVRFGSMVIGGEANNDFDYSAIKALAELNPSHRDTVGTLIRFVETGKSYEEERRECFERLVSFEKGKYDVDIDQLFLRRIKDPSESLEMRAFAAECYYKRNPDTRELIGPIKDLMEENSIVIEEFEREVISGIRDEDRDDLIGQGIQNIKALECFGKIDIIKESGVSLRSMETQFTRLTTYHNSSISTPAGRIVEMRTRIQIAESLFAIDGDGQEYIDFLKNTATSTDPEQDKSVTIAAIEALGKVGTILRTGQGEGVESEAAGDALDALFERALAGDGGTYNGILELPRNIVKDKLIKFLPGFVDRSVVDAQVTDIRMRMLKKIFIKAGYRDLNAFLLENCKMVGSDKDASIKPNELKEKDIIACRFIDKNGKMFYYFGEFAYLKGDFEWSIRGRIIRVNNNLTWKYDGTTSLQQSTYPIFLIARADDAAAIRKRVESAQASASPTPPDDGGRFGPGKNVRKYTDATMQEFAPAGDIIPGPKITAARMSAEELAGKADKKYTTLDELVKRCVNPVIGKNLKALKIAAAEFKKTKPRSIILYADDILNNAVMYDFEKSLGILKESGVLDGGKVILGLKDEKMLSEAEGLKALIESGLGSDVEVLIVKQWEDDSLKSCKNATEEVRSLVNIARRHGANDILGVIRGSGMNWAETFKDYDLKIPLVIINDSVKGVYSFSKAVLIAIETKARLDNLPGSDFSEWIKQLPYIKVITDEMYREYILYRDEVLTKA